jgi:hypothetical protein
MAGVTGFGTIDAICHLMEQLEDLSRRPACMLLLLGAVFNAQQPLSNFFAIELDRLGGDLTRLADRARTVMFAWIAHPRSLAEMRKLMGFSCECSTDERGHAFVLPLQRHTRRARGPC